MSTIETHKTTKNNEENKMNGKSPQELYDKYIRKGDESIISEDIVLAEKYYQHADHYLRMMNDPHHFEVDSEIPHPATPRSIEDLIGKAFKGIVAERTAKKTVIDEKAIQVAKSAKAASSTNKRKSVKTKSVQQMSDVQNHIIDCNRERS